MAERKRVAGLGVLAVAVCAEAFDIAYPKPYTLFQRDSASEGAINVRGTFPEAQRPEKIEARFNGGAWRVLDARIAAKDFAGSMKAPVGQGLLEVRGLGGGGSALAAKVACVGIGDLFVIAGQSNADGRGNELAKLDPGNPYVGVKFRKGVWSEGSDPATNDGDKSGSPWPIVLNRLIPDQNVPMGFIAAAVGSTVVKQWRRGDGKSTGSLYARMREMIKVATDGSMKFRAVIYYQGENDITHYNTLSVLGDYTAYKENLMAMVSDFWEEFKAPVLVGQITNLGGDRQKNDHIRQVQQEVWKEHPHALPGAVTYDIHPTDGVHYRDTANMGAFARRWSAAVLSGVYNRKEMAAPKLAGLRKKGDKQLVFTYDQALALASWDGQAGTKAEGFSFMDGDQVWAGGRVVSTALAGKEVTVEVSAPLPANLRVCYGNGPDGQGKVVLRSAATGLPIPMLFGRNLDL